MNTRSEDASGKHIMTTTQAAAMLGVAVSTVQKWVESGRLLSWKTPGGHRRIALASVRQILRDSAAPLRAGVPAADMRSPPAPQVFTAQALPEVTDEQRRVYATRATRLLDTPAHGSYDRLVRIAALLTEMPIALISLLDADRQWFKSRVGISMTETPRSWAFCNYTVLNSNIMIVEDATLDLRFSANPLVTGHEAIRFYAGVPLVDGNAARIGSLCVLDRKPRQLSQEQIWALTELAAMVSEEILRGVAAGAFKPPAIGSPRG